MQNILERTEARVPNHRGRNRGGGRGPTTPRRLVRTEDRSENRFETINGHSILLGTNLQGEKLVLATENSVGATVELRERLYRGVLLNKHILSGG